jgi:YD repeat-containing protein
MRPRATTVFADLAIGGCVRALGAVLPAAVLVLCSLAWSPGSFAQGYLASFQWWQVDPSSRICVKDAQNNCVAFSTALEACSYGFAGIIKDIEPSSVFIFGASPNRQIRCVGHYSPGCSSGSKCSYGVDALERAETGSCSTTNAILSGTTCTCKVGFLQADDNCSGGKNNACSVAVPSIANPCNPASGNKFQREAVYRGTGVGALELTLSFNTDDPHAATFGRRWRHSFDRKVVGEGTGFIVYRGNGKAFLFTPSGGTWATDADTPDRLIQTVSPPGWEWHAADREEIETYDAAGRLLAIQARSGMAQTFVHSDGTSGPNGGLVLDANGEPTATVLPPGLLIRASDHFGRSLTFGYDANSRVIKMTDPAVAVYRFGYDGAGNLRSITFPDMTVRTFHYNEPANTGGTHLPNALTGITDENELRFSTYQYNAQERVTLTEHAGNANRYTFSYGAGWTAVVDPYSTARTYSFSTLLNAFKNTAIGGAPCPSCGAAGQSFDVHGNVASRTDWNGNTTAYTYELSRNLEISRTEGLTSHAEATPQTRTISTQWHPSFRLPTAVAEPLRITTNVYDSDGSACGARGALCSRTVQATNDASGTQMFAATAAGTPRPWTYTYNANGSVLTVDGPRNDVADVTTYTYYPNDDSDIGKRGNVASVTNALGQATSITAYNAHGQPLAIVDPNGLTTTMVYDARQRLTSRVVGNETTSYEYDNVGQLIKITLPDGSVLLYSYDAAHRLIGIQDSLGNRIAYTLDAMGNRTLEQVFDPAGALAQTRSRVYSDVNRLFRDIGALNQTTEYTYDNQGNVTSVTDPLHRVTAGEYDALNRLKQVTDPALGVTQYTYNGLDTLTQVSDPRNLATSYTVDGFGNVTLQVSPDAGYSASTYDDAGNLLTHTDAKGQLTRYTYDALNRVTRITFHDGSTQAHSYDHGTHGLGRLSSIREADPANQEASLIQYYYDEHGRAISEMRTIGGMQYTTGYTFDAFGRLAALTHPSGRVVRYSFDSAGRISGITSDFNGQAQMVVADVSYHPFGGVKSYTLGNGQSYVRTYDTDGRISSYTLGSATFSIGYDDASRIEFISQFGNPANSNTYGYDPLDRLTSASTPGTAYGYTYDAVGNRLTKTAGAATDAVTYSATSNRVATLTPNSGSARAFVFDPNGSTTNDGINSYVYDARGRMVQAAGGAGLTRYQVNALGQRIRKSNSQGDTIFHYDARGTLIAESEPSGKLKREYIYLQDIPVAVVVGP